MIEAPARADNEFLGQAQRFFNDRGADRNAYGRGREDEIRSQQAERGQYRYHRDYYQDLHRWLSDKHGRAALGLHSEDLHSEDGQAHRGAVRRRRVQRIWADKRDEWLQNLPA